MSFAPVAVLVRSKKQQVAAAVALQRSDQALEAVRQSRPPKTNRYSLPPWLL